MTRRERRKQIHSIGTKSQKMSLDFCNGESFSLLSLPLLFPHSSPPPSLFFGDYSTMHLPVETAATHCYDPNTAVWCDDWLREGAGVGWGCSAALSHPHISSTTFKIQTFIQARNRPIPPIISPSFFPHLSCHSSVTPSLQFLLLPIFSSLSPPVIPPVFPPHTSPGWIRTEK